MTHRERFLATLHNGTPDRIPIVANLTIQAAEKIAAALGTEVGFVDSFLATRISHREILLKMGNDAVLVAATPATPSVVLENGDVRDELGITYRNVGLYAEAVGRPLSECESLEDLARYRLPDPLAPQSGPSPRTSSPATRQTTASSATWRPACLSCPGTWWGWRSSW